jgi:hypothetical protein
LDECYEPDRVQLFKAIAAVHNGMARRTNLKFLLTSRPYDHICRLSSIHLQGDSRPASKENEAEIELVIKSRVAGNVRIFRLGLEQRELMEIQLNAVPNRTYLWITLVFDGLMKKKDLCMPQDMKDPITKFPVGVYEADEKILKRSPMPNDARRI